MDDDDRTSEEAQGSQGGNTTERLGHASRCPIHFSFLVRRTRFCSRHRVAALGRRERAFIMCTIRLIN